MSLPKHTNQAVLAAIILIGGLLRFTGLDRGWSDFVLPEARAQGQEHAFYSFNPDEAALIEGALVPYEPLNPPYTSYGMLPATLLRGSLFMATSILGWDDLTGTSPTNRRRVFVTARVLAATASTLLIPMTWWLGVSLLGRTAGALAALVVALSPGAIQQAHFFIVDGFLALCSMAALVAILSLSRRSSSSLVVLSGVLIGLGMAVRLTAGLLGIVLAVAVVLREREAAPESPWIRRLWHRDIWIAAAVAATTLIALEPFLLVRPQLMWTMTGPRSFANAVLVGDGTILRTWTLVDLEVIPLLSHWVGGMPLAVGWPLAILFVVVWGWALVRGTLQMRLVALWCALFFFPVGMLTTRAIRYVVPLVPPLACLLGVAAARLQEKLPRQGGWMALVIGVLLMGELGYRGTTMGRMYSQEDSRIQAAREIAQRVPAGTPIGVEGSGYTMAHFVDHDRNPRVWFDVSRLFYATPYSTCEDRAWHLHKTLTAAEYLAIAEENRSIQFRAAASRFPVIAGFYEMLQRGEMGYQPVAVFGGNESVKVPVPGTTDPSFTGFDRPRVWVYQRESTEALDRSFEQLTNTVVHSGHCPDDALRAAVRTEDLSDALVALEALEKTIPFNKLATRLRAEILLTEGAMAEAEALFGSYLPLNATGETRFVRHSAMHHYATAFAARSIARLGLPDLAVQIVREMHHYSQGTPEWPYALVQELNGVADVLRDAGHTEQMAQVLAHNLRVEESVQLLNLLANYWLKRDPARGVAFLKRSLEIDPGQTQARERLRAATED